MYSYNVLGKVIDALIRVKKVLEEKPDAKIYIGKTDNCVRREQEHKMKGFSNFTILVENLSLEEANKIESVLIKILHCSYKDSIENDNEGGGGNTAEKSENGNYIYLVIK